MQHRGLNNKLRWLPERFIAQHQHSRSPVGPFEIMNARLNPDDTVRNPAKIFTIYAGYPLEILTTYSGYESMTPRS